MKFRLREIVSPSYRMPPATSLLALSVFYIALVTLDDASMALLAFCYLMWATMPWAFIDTVDKRLKDNETELEQEFGEDWDSPSAWLDSSTSLFLYAGTIFLFTLLISLAKPAVPDLSSFNTSFPFVVATFFLIGAVFNANRVIRFVLNPKTHPSGLKSGLEVNSFDAATALGGFLVLDILLYSSIFYPLNPILDWGILNAFGKSFFAALVASLLGAAVLIAIRKRRPSYFNLIATLMLFSPIIIISYIVLGGSL